MTRQLVIALVLALAIPAHGEDVRGSDARVRQIIQDALDEALHDQVKHLFVVWLKDDKGQPHRAATGIRKAVTAYRHAIEAIEEEDLTQANGK